MSITRTNLLASTALIAALLAIPATASATNDFDTGDTIIASDVAGLLDTDGLGAAIALGIESNTQGSVIVLGADGVKSLVTDVTQTSGEDVTVTITTVGTAYGVTFADDVEAAESGDSIVINSTTDNLIFEGNVTGVDGTNAINMGSGAADPALSVTFDTANAENLVIDAAIDAVDLTDTITMNVTNTQGGGNTIDFSQAIGGNFALDVLNIGELTTATFDLTVDADTINIESENTTTFTGLVTGDINLAADGTVAVTAGVSGDVNNTTGADGAGTLALGAGADVGGDVGATNSLLAVTAVTTGGTAFGGDVNATTITLSGTGTATVVGDVVGNVVVSGGTPTLAMSADKSVTGNISNTSGAAAGSVTFAASTDDVTLVSGTIGAGATTAALSAVTVATGVGTQTFGGAVQANTVTLSGTGDVAFTDDVTASTKLNLTGDNTVTFAANKKIIGNLDASGNQGTVTFGATTTDTTLVSGTVGASNDLLAVNVAPATGVTATFADAYAVSTTTHSGAGTVAFSGAVTGDVDISGGGTVTAAGAVVGDIDNTGTAGTGTLTLASTIGVDGAVGTTAGLATVTINSGAGTSTMTGAVTATNIILSGTTGTTAFQGDVTGAVAFTDDSIATVTADEKIIGSVTTGTTNEGTLTFATTATNTTLVSGNVGTSTKKLLAVNAGAASGITATFGGDVNATTVTLTGNGADATSTFALNGDVNATTLDVVGVEGAIVNVAAGKNITAAITADTSDKTTLNFAGTSTVTGLVGVIGANNLLAMNVDAGTVTLANNFAVATTTVDAGATLKTNGALTFEGIIANSGTLDLGGTLTATAAGGAVELGGTVSTSKITLARASDYTSSTVIDATTVQVNATNPVEVTAHTSFTSGSLTLAKTDGTGTADAADFSAATSTLATYAFTDSGNNVVMTATQKSAATVAATLGSTSDAASALLAGVNATVADATVADAYNTAVQAGGIAAKTAADQSQQSGVSFASQAMTTASRGMTGAVSSRMSSARTGMQVAGLSETGLAAGGSAMSNAAWSKAFGSYADQGERSGFAGYDASTYGVAFGVDREVSNMVRLGVAASYAGSNIDGKDLGNSDTDINAYQFAVYGSYEPGKYFVEGQLAYAYNQVDTKRTINFGGLNRTASGDYDANQISATIGAGLPMKSGSFTFVPKAGLFYSHTSADSYTETGAGAMNLVVDPGNTNVLEGSIGATVSYEHKLQEGVLRPELRAAVMYEFLDEDASTSSKFTGSATTFNTKGLKPAQFGSALGLGVGYTTADGVWDLQLDYDAEIREDLTSHGGMLMGRFHF